MGPKLGIALIGTLDTKGAEIEYVRDRLAKLGTRPVVIDSGILGEPGCRADVTREEVARAVSGRTVKSIVFASPCAPVGALADDLALVGS